MGPKIKSVTRATKIVEIPEKNRGEISKDLSLGALRDVFSDLFASVSVLPPTKNTHFAKIRLTDAYESMELVINEIYERKFEHRPSTLELV